MAEHVGADRGIEREAVHAVAGGVDHDRRRAVDHVAGGELLRAAVAGRRRWDRRIAASVRHGEDREDRADADVDVDVRGAVERIEHDDVLAAAGAAIEGDRLFVLFGGDHADVFADAQAVHQRFVGVDVELLLLLRPGRCC